MARKSLRPQLNQIRAWVRQGRTDAWIAHQLEVSASQLQDFRKRHGLDTEGEEPDADVDLRDEIEAEIEAELSEPPEEEDEAEVEEGTTEVDAGDETDGRECGRKRRRRRRGGRGRRGRRGGGPLEATFDHGDTDGYGLWLDPAVKDNPVYSEHWAGKRDVTVRIEADQIVIRRAGAPEDGDGDSDASDD
jgi:hypothetical protein